MENHRRPLRFISSRIKGNTLLRIPAAEQIGGYNKNPGPAYPRPPAPDHVAVPDEKT
jgi:hypothetical protein